MLFLALRRLKSQDEAKRLEAVQEIRASKDSRSTDYLIPSLKDPSFLVRTVVAESLGELGDKRALEPLRSLLTDQESGVRQSAMSALVQLADPDIQSRLIPMLKDPDRSVRQSAARILKENPSPEVASSLAEYFAEEEERQKKAEAERSRILAEREQTLSDARQDAEDQKYIRKLLELATFFSSGGLRQENLRLVNEVVEIGKKLYQRGGIAEMQRIWVKMPPVEGKRSVELQWNEIGDWGKRWMIPTENWHRIPSI